MDRIYCVKCTHYNQDRIHGGACHLNPPDNDGLWPPANENGWCGQGKPVKPHEDEKEWFYKALGWMMAEACMAVDKGLDIRQDEIPALAYRAERELSVPWELSE